MGLFESDDLPRVVSPTAKIRGFDGAIALGDWGEVFVQLKLIEAGYPCVRTSFGHSRSDLYWVMPLQRPLRVQVKATETVKQPGARSKLAQYSFPTDIVHGEFDVAVFVARDIGIGAWMFGHEIGGSVTLGPPGTPHTGKTKYGNIDQFPIERIIEEYNGD